MDGCTIPSELVVVVVFGAFFAMVMAVADLIRLLIERRDKRKNPCNKRWWEMGGDVGAGHGENRAHSPFVGFSGDGEVVIYEKKHLDELEEVL